MSSKDYRYEVSPFKVSPEMKAEFDKKGFVRVRNLLSDAELKRMHGFINEDNDVVKEYVYDVNDGAGRNSRMMLWSKTGNDFLSMLARSEKVATTCEQVTTITAEPVHSHMFQRAPNWGEVDHYHSKVMMKDAQTGGRFAWHQDYGYWYHSAFLFPDLVFVFIALDPCRQDNGCMQFLEGSHRCGRIEHHKIAQHVDGQMEADPERIEQLKKRCPHTYVELQPGDAIFTHCNTLHCTSQNNSPHRRWTFVCAFNRADNPPCADDIQPFCSKFTKVPDSAILESKLDWDLDSIDMFTQKKRDRFWKNFETEEITGSN